MKNKIQPADNPLAQDFNIGSLLGFAFPTIVMMIFMGLLMFTGKMNARCGFMRGRVFCDGKKWRIGVRVKWRF